MNETSVGVVAAVCVCIAITAAGVGLRVWFARGRPSLCGWRSGRKSSWRQQYQQQSSKDGSRDSESVHGLSIESALDKLEGMAAQRNYAYACQYAEAHPIDDSTGLLSSSDLELIAEHGANAWQFVADEDNVGVSVRDGTEVEFAGGEQSLVANLQFPNEQRVYYYEVRLTRLAPGTNVAVGVAMRSYPPLRLAGWARNSVGYHTCDGCVYHSHPLDICRKARPAQTSDTLGVGWRPRSGKAFFAINGVIVGHVRTPWAQKRLYPIVSADGPCSLSVNMGTRAFVLSHANMRYWAVAPPEGQRPPPPLYHCASESLLLATSPPSSVHSSSTHDIPPGYDDDHHQHFHSAPHSAIDVDTSRDD
ncbi:Protein ssh4 [Coemansia sp. RSA 455]|nr:Protein ssh4 [Coemansia sp. S680]KAJ2027098.1 Protein ssh4 [Coemansia sp. S3946]KAJ2052738.1 Protein ssh4 [Coemansia sp. S16]KAJ2253981.1 Protein ssh4 [Coemansia sp. RSA 455]KAJ2469164.1 Protein ssh4 [Coemansia sp. RSA 2337]